MRSNPFLPVTLILVAAATAAHGGDIGYGGWGPRVGIGTDPDQVIVGVHFDLGEVAEHVVFTPDVELGLGDDHTILAFTAPFAYRWERLTGTEIVPYAGGGITAALVDTDRDDTDAELALKALGGGEWPLERGRKFFVELQFVVGDVHDLELLAGWRLPK